MLDILLNTLHLSWQLTFIYYNKYCNLISKPVFLTIVLNNFLINSFLLSLAIIYVKNVLIKFKKAINGGYPSRNL